jgi:hypothetical protein
MKSLLLAGAIMLAITTVCFAEQLDRVVGNRATNQCEIVTSSPVVIGNIRFEDGPYKNPSTMPSSRAPPSAPVPSRLPSEPTGDQCRTLSPRTP